MPETGSPRAAVPAWLPSPLLLVLAVVGTILVLATLARGLIDADYFWHLETGRLIATEWSVPSTDPYSFAYDGSWTPHEWLSELLIYVLVAAGGAAADPTSAPTLALVAFGLVAAASLVVLGLALERCGMRTAPIAGAIAIATMVLFAYVTVRPQVISWLMLAGLLGFLLQLKADRPRRAWWLVPFFVLWANLHGLWVVGMVVVGMYVLFTVAGRTPMRAARGTILATGVACLLATALTPAGPAGILYPLRYLEPGDWGLANIAEWQSPDFHDPAHLGLLVLIVTLILLGSRGVAGWLTAVSIVGVVMALISLRNAPVGAILALPSVAMALDARMPEQRPARDPRARRILEIGVAIVLIGATLVTLVPRVGQADTLASRYPVASVDLLAERDPDVRLLAEYGWAGYAIERLHRSGGQVFVDGRNDMYPQPILEDYSTIRAAGEGWEGLTDGYGVEAMLFPPDASAVRAAVRDAGWCEAFRNETQVLLMRTC
jgi:hypothetical protein